MKLSLCNNAHEVRLEFQNTKHKLGIQIWGDIDSFRELYELASECWIRDDCETTRAEECSYIGVILYFCYTIRHTFMGDRFVKLDGKPVKEWSDDMMRLFEDEPERFMVGVDFTWPHVLFIIASWWECIKRHECPVRVLPIMRQFTENIESLLQERSKTQYPSIEPYINGAIYAANPYLMHTMEHINVEYLFTSKFGKISLRSLADMMRRSAFGTWEYEDYLTTLKKHAKKLGCQIEDLKEQVDDKIYDTEL